MGFTKDIAITNDDDFVSYAWEPNLARFLTDIDEAVANFSNLHKRANNKIMDTLLSKGIVLSRVANTDNFKQASIYYVLHMIFLGRIDVDPDQATIKAEQYKMLFDEEMESRVVELSSLDKQDEQPGQADMPTVHNIDHISRLKHLRTREQDVDEDDEWDTSNDLS